MKIKWRDDSLYEMRSLPKLVALLENISGNIADRAN